jgi:hypothetical protein
MYRATAVRGAILTTWCIINIGPVTVYDSPGSQDLCHNVTDRSYTHTGQVDQESIRTSTNTTICILVLVSLNHLVISYCQIQFSSILRLSHSSNKIQTA